MGLLPINSFKAPTKHEVDLNSHFMKGRPTPDRLSEIGRGGVRELAGLGGGTMQGELGSPFLHGVAWKSCVNKERIDPCGL